METSHNKDSYARVGLANIAYQASCLFRSEVQKQEDYMRYAMRQYFGILEIDENNCFGPLGIANLLTEYSKVDEAKEIYKLLAISEPDSQVGLNSMLNQAHILTFENSFDQAIKLYEVCLTKRPGDIDIQMYLSKAYFKKNDFEGCAKLTKNLMMKNPSDIRLKYNLAYCLYKEADQIFNLKTRRVSQTRHAIKNLEHAHALFQ